MSEESPVDPCDIARRKTGVAFTCCPSCHDDWDEFDYEMCYVTVDGQELHVCCRAYNAVMEKPESRNNA